MWFLSGFFWGQRKGAKHAVEAFKLAKRSVDEVGECSKRIIKSLVSALETVSQRAEAAENKLRDAQQGQQGK